MYIKETLRFDELYKKFTQMKEMDTKTFRYFEVLTSSYEEKNPHHLFESPQSPEELNLHFLPKSEQAFIQKAIEDHVLETDFMEQRLVFHESGENHVASLFKEIQKQIPSLAETSTRREFYHLKTSVYDLFEEKLFASKREEMTLYLDNLTHCISFKMFDHFKVVDEEGEVVPLTTDFLYDIDVYLLDAIQQAVEMGCTSFFIKKFHFYGRIDLTGYCFDFSRPLLHLSILEENALNESIESFNEEQ